MDTPSKRFSAVAVILPFRGAGYLPDGTTDRQAAAFMYEGIAAAPPAPVVVPSGGGIGKRRRKKYPRRVMVRGRVVLVASEAEEVRLLREMAEDIEVQAKILAAAGDEMAAKRAQRAAEKLQSRALSAEQLRQIWLDYLRREDEEVLRILGVAA